MSGIEINIGTLIMLLVQAVILILMILLVKMFKNGGSKVPINGNPGKATVCIKRGEKIKEHDIVIKHLCEDLDEEKKDRKQFRVEIRQSIYNVCEELRKINRSK